ncbi:MAG: ABC transporter ATP-binding protein, partial [Candidatus Thiodiazotropha taylori]|nr:ABC transporter ATP-binding protein [Candidatus Thiodiazotropha taylori]
AASRKERKRQEAEQRKRLQPLRQALGKFEQQIEQLQQKQKDIELMLSDNSLYDESRKEELKRWLAEKRDVDSKLNDCEERWLETSEQLEAVQSEEKD